MDTVQQAKKVLSDTEMQLRQLIERGLREQRYDDVAELAGLAQGVSRLLQGRVTDPLSSEAAPAQPLQHTETATVKKANSKLQRAAFPRFERDGDKLVKVGWSKKNKSSYEHRASKEAVIAFARHLSNSVHDGKVFAVEDLLPVPDVANGGELPAYQVYLTLAWLRHTGTVHKKGRDGYVLRQGGLANGEFDRLWTELPTRAA